MALFLGLLLVPVSRLSHAQIFGTVRVVALDPMTLPIPAAEVVIQAKASAWSQRAKTDAQGQQQFLAVPVGEYIVSVSAEGLAEASKAIEVASNLTTSVQLQLAIAGVTQVVDVRETVETINPQSSTTGTLTSRRDILMAPDGDRSGSLAMITNNVPGTFVMHDHLHSRGGHGVTWAIDGVPVPNSNLATVGSQFDPKDVDYLEVQRGGLSANHGDRSYGIFNVVPRSGFEGHRFGEFIASYGSYNQTNEYLSFGDHSGRFAYFGSLSGSRTDRGLERVDIPVIHDQASAFSGFTSFLYNPTSRDQLRLVSSARTNHYQVPNTVEQHALGIRDVVKGTDTFTNFTWVHTAGSGTLLTASPYYHYNRGQYIGGKASPIVTEDDRASHYAGGYVSLAVTKGKHTVRIGTNSFVERNAALFGLTANDGSGLSLRVREKLTATVMSVFIDDSYRVNAWLTLNNGLRYQRYSGTLTEHATSPRLGAAIRVPHVGVLRGSYGRYYQHPQVSTISGPVLEFALQSGFDFLPLAGERDEVWEIGLGIPFRGWELDFTRFHNAARNLVDHEVLGNSNLLLPLTIEKGRIRSYESTLRSPLLFQRLKVHYSLAYMTAQGKGAVTGGLTDFQAPEGQFFYLDHDQRVTLNAGAEISLPRAFWASGTVLYGSGYLKGDGPEHMPQHTTFNLSVGKNITENLSLRVTALNVTDSLFLTGWENSFAGTHYADPREISVQLRYRFRY